MRYRMLDANLDYTFGNNKQDFLVNSSACVAQAIRTALLLLQGEWFLDATAGVAWLTDVVGIGTAGTYDTIIRNAVLGVAGVQNIVSYSSQLQETVLIVNVVVNTIYGSQAAVNNLALSPP